MARLSRDTQRKWVLRHREILAITEGVLPSSEIHYKAIFDAFHSPYPKVAGDHLELRGDSIDTWVREDLSDNQALDCFSRLPLEVFELIFTNLSASALDAARFTCRALHDRIMSSSHVLEAVVNLDKLGETRCLTKNRLREMGRQLDEDADLLKHPIEPGGWRVRHRHCGIEFSYLLSDNTNIQRTSGLPALLVNARFCIDGTPIAALIAKSQGPDWTSKIFLYHFCISGRPRYIGLIPLIDSENPVFIRSAAVTDRTGTWRISIEVGRNISQYRVDSSKAFSIDQPAFTIKPDNSPLQAKKTPTIPDLDIKNWVLLSRLPSRNDQQADATETYVDRAELFHLARHVETNQLYTVCVRSFSSFAEDLRSSSASPKIESLAPIAKLLPPHQHATYRNIATAPRPAVDGTIQIAVIWQTPTPHGHASELYIYEIPALYHAFSTEIQAKRVQSLGLGIGGIHPSSLFHTSPDPPSTTEPPSITESQGNALSGLSFLQIAQNVDLYRHIPKQRIYIYAWGPSSSSSSSCNSNPGIKLHIFDISYSTPFLNSLNTLPPHLRPGAAYMRKVDPGDPWGNVCQCALHDDGYRVVLPQLGGSRPVGNAAAETRIEAEGKSPTSRWLRIFTRKQDHDGKEGVEAEEEKDLGSVEWRVDGHVQAALDRKEEWLREKVRVLKRAGLDDEGVVMVWDSRPWTRFGIVGLPRGWRDL